MLVRKCLLAASFSLAVASLALADVTGKVTLTGKAPEMAMINMAGVKECAALHADPVSEETVVCGDKGELANVVVYVKTDDPDALGGQVPAEAAVLDQKGCQYVPHVLAMMKGQKLSIRNDDTFLHNVHSLAQTNPPFNFGQPNKDPGKPVDPPKAAENIKIKCDVHPWMSAWIIVLDHPFFAVTKEDGTFAIKGLPAGDYTLVAWHEKYGPSAEQKVSVKDGKAEVNFTFKAESAAMPLSEMIARVASGEIAGSPIMASSSGAKVESCCEPTK